MKRQEKVELLPNIVESLIGDTADLYLLFIDLCGSTEYKQHCIISKQPDLIWIFRQLIFLERSAKIIKKYDGKVVKTIGDEVFAYFEVSTEPEYVLKCAIEIIQSFDNLKAFNGISKIEAKASIDFGLTYNGSIVDSVSFDPIGLPVDRCARLNSIAVNNQIIFSEVFFDLANTKSSTANFKNK